MHRLLVLGMSAALAVALLSQGPPPAEAAKIKARKDPKKSFNAFANFGDIKGEATDKAKQSLKRKRSK